VRIADSSGRARADDWELFLFPAVRVGAQPLVGHASFRLSLVHTWCLIAIALLATVNALTSQTIFGKTLATVLVGPALAAVGDIHFLRVEGRASRNLK